MLMVYGVLDKFGMTYILGQYTFRDSADSLMWSLKNESTNKIRLNPFTGNLDNIHWVLKIIDPT